MDAFGYLGVLLSIILGLGMSQLLTAVGRIVRARDRVRVAFAPLAWAAILLLLYVQFWWSLFDLRERSAWTFLEFSVVLLQAALFYLLAALALPEDPVAEGGDLGQHYARQAPWFFGVLLAALAASLGRDLVLWGRLPDQANLAFHALMVAVGVIALASRRPLLHAVLAATTAAALLAYVGLLFWRLD
jgi:hypothetical protein